MAHTGYSSGANASLSGGTGSASEDEGYSVAKLRRQYLDFAGAKQAEIDEQRLARHYFHADQWTSSEIEVLKKRKQPVVTRNKIDRKINGVVGLVERLRQDPKAFPRTPKHEEGAETATASIRYSLDASDWPTCSSEAARNSAINGIGGVELSLEQGDQNDPEVSLAIVDPETFFYDPRSVRYDFSDARYMGVAKWVDLELAQEMFPESSEELAGLIGSGGGLESNQQRDRERIWVNTELRRVFLIEHWHMKGGAWNFCFYVADVKLRSGPSPFTDEKGKSVCRFIMFSVNIDHDGDRYGFVRGMKSLQDEINHRASKGLHILNTRRIIAERGALDSVESGGRNGVEAARIEAARPDGVIEYTKGFKFEFDDQAKVADLQGQLEFLAEVKAEIENFGPNPAVIGEGIENKSGRAIALLQQAGIAELGPFILSYRGWKIRVYRAVWNIIQKYWTAERWIRVTDDEGLAKFLQLNALTIDEYGRPALTNAVGALDVDIIIDEGPDTINLMQDTYDTLTALAQKGQAVPPEVLIELAPLPAETKRKLLGILEKAAAGDPAKRELEIDNAKAETGATKAKGLKDFASAIHEFAEIGTMPERMSREKLSSDREDRDSDARDRTQRERSALDRTRLGVSQLGMGS